MPLQIKYFNKEGVFVSITKLISRMCSIFQLVWLKAFKIQCVLLHIKNEMRSSILICYDDLLIILTRKSNCSHFSNIYCLMFYIISLAVYFKIECCAALFFNQYYFSRIKISDDLFSEWSSNLIAPIHMPISYAVYNRIYLIHSLCFCFHSAIKKL